MGILDFFKKPAVAENKKLELKELDKWINSKNQEISQKEQDSTAKIKNSVSKLVEELKHENQTLKQITLEKIREEERIKLIVKENLNNYIQYLENLTEKLESLPYESLPVLVNEVNSTFSDFEKRSIFSYQKATILIGKELGAVKRSLRDFSRRFEEILNEDKQFKENSKTIFSINSKITEKQNLAKKRQLLNQSIQESEKVVAEIEKYISEKQRLIEKTKQTQDYLDYQLKKQAIDKEKENLQKEVLRLREIIDFKQLASIFHTDEKKMKVIKEYKSDFLQAFEKDSGERLLATLGDIKESQRVIEQINKISEIKKQIKKVNLGADKVQELGVEISKSKISIQGLRQKNFKDIKKEQKVKEDIDKTVNLIKAELLNMNIDLEK
ncbi:MAG: hypothetical protein ABIE22_03100 [archaeon]